MVIFSADEDVLDDGAQDALSVSAPPVHLMGGTCSATPPGMPSRRPWPAGDLYAAVRSSGAITAR